MKHLIQFENKYVHIEYNKRSRFCILFVFIVQYYKIYLLRLRVIHSTMGVCPWACSPISSASALGTWRAPIEMLQHMLVSVNGL